MSLRNRFQRVHYELTSPAAWIVVGWLGLATALYGFVHRDEFRAYFDRAAKAYSVIEFPAQEFAPGVTVKSEGIVRKAATRLDFDTPLPADHFVLPPRSEGTLVVRFEKPAGYLMDLWPNVPIVEPGEYRIELRTDRVSEFQTVLEGRPFHWGGLLPLMSPALAEELRLSSDFELRLTANNPTDREVTVLNWLWVRVHEPIRADFFVLPGLFGLWGLLLSVLALTWTLSSPRTCARALAAVGMLATCGILAWIYRAGPFFSHAIEYRYLKWGVLGLSLILSLSGKLSNRGFLFVTAPIWFAASSLWFWDEAANNFYGYLHGSVDAWTLRGREMSLFTQAHGFFSGSFREREPVHVLLVHLFGKAFGASNFSHLNLTLLLMTFGAAITYVAGGLLIGRPWITLTLGYSLCYYLLHSSIIADFQREAFSFPLMAVATLAIFYRSSGRMDLKGRGAILIGLSVLLVLTRGAFFTSIAAMVVLAMSLRLLARSMGWRAPHRYEWAVLGLLILAPALAQLPIKLNQANKYGSSSYFTDRYARWIANVEFLDRLGTPGFPTQQEFLADSYAGPRIRYTEYLFKLRSPHDFIKMNYEGMGVILKLHAKYLLRGLKLSGERGAWMLWATLAICAIWVSRRERSWMLFWLTAWYLAQNAYAFHLFKQGIIGSRHVDHAFFTFVVLVGLTGRKMVDHASLILTPFLSRRLLRFRVGA